MLVKKHERVMHKNSGACTAYEYPMDDKDINVALVDIDGRYPEQGSATNETVKELIFVSHGTGRVVIEGKSHDLSEGDSVLILPNKRYSLEGKLRLVISGSPAWYPEQHKHLD